MRPKALATTIALGVLLTIASPAGAQQYQPTVGQEGKDVVWVPTPPELVTAMLDMAKVTPQDFVMDLGSGDGRTVITAAKRGARAMGIGVQPGHGRVVEAERGQGRPRREGRYLRGRDLTV
jgi:tRNA G46 methylase TrmB